jgi:hypothetical protein
MSIVVLATIDNIQQQGLIPVYSAISNSRQRRPATTTILIINRLSTTPRQCRPQPNAVLASIMFRAANLCWDYSFAALFVGLFSRLLGAEYVFIDSCKSNVQYQI